MRGADPEFSAVASCTMRGSPSWCCRRVPQYRGAFAPLVAVNVADSNGIAFCDARQWKCFFMSFSKQASWMLALAICFTFPVLVISVSVRDRVWFKKITVGKVIALEKYALRRSMLTGENDTPFRVVVTFCRRGKRNTAPEAR